MVETERIPSVYELIADRVTSESRLNQRQDPYVLGLIVEGGGMATVTSAGAATGLAALNIPPAIDRYYGISGGACVIPYLISGQVVEGASIFYQNLQDPEFINFLRALQKKPIINIPYLTEDVMMHKKPLRWEEVISSQAAIHMYATSAKDAREIDLTSFRTREELHDAMHWSSRVPVIGGMPLEKNGIHYTDGGVLLGAIPLKQAMKDGCTHILVLLAHADNARTQQNTAFIESFIVRALREEYPELAKVYWQNYGESIDSLSMVRTAEIQQRLGIRSGPQIAAIKPPNSVQRVGFLEQSPDVLYRAACKGFKATVQALSQYELPINTGVYIRS